MKNMTTKQKVYLGIVVLGVLIVAVDRFILSPEESGPAAAEASASPAPSAGVRRPAGRANGEKPDSNKAASAQADMGRLTRRLNDIAAGQNVDPQTSVDGFAISAAWQAVAAPKSDAAPGQVGAETPQEALRRRARTFIEAHRLDGVVVNPTQPAAILDGNLLRVGERIGDFELVAVDARSATFQIEGARFTLTLRDAVGGR